MRCTGVLSGFLNPFFFLFFVCQKIVSELHYRLCKMRRKNSRISRALCEKKMTTLSTCLASLGLTAADFSTTGADPDAGFGVVKRAYFKLALSSHPDKGGDPSVFRAVQEAWESVREAHESGQIAGAWAAYCEGGGAASAPARGARVGVVPSYSWFTAAAAEAVPPYIVEHARSSRSSCTQKSATFCAHLDPLIEKGEVRCGSLDPESGGYGRFMHLRCWRVPATVWLGLPTAGADTTVVETALAAMESVTLIGFPTLDVTGKAAFVAHVTDSTNWARLSGKAKAANDAADAAASGEISGAASASTVPKKVKGKSKDSKAAAVEQAVVDVVMSSPKSGAALVPVLARATTGIGSFLLPRPGVNGAVAGALSGKTFVLTGVFPEVGGGLGLDLGKARVRECVESFGGRVTGSVSGATTHLIVGQAPGASKVRSARSKGVAMLDVQGLKVRNRARAQSRGSLPRVASLPSSKIAFHTSWPHPPRPPPPLHLHSVPPLDRSREAGRHTCRCARAYHNKLFSRVFR